MSKRTLSSGKALINLTLIVICIGTLAGVAVPALKHKNKRDAFREITDTALTITNTIEKCLGLERDSALCDTPEKLIPYGFSAVDIKLNTLISDADISLVNDKYSVTFTPPDSNQKAPFILPIHDYIREAEIIDRNGRPVIESWTTNSKSGCLQQAFCS